MLDRSDGECCRTYTYQEIAELLEKAQAMGFSLEEGSELEKYTVRELDILVNRKM